MSGDILFDETRDARIGIPEAVLCEGKSFSALSSLFSKFEDPAAKPILFTRLSEEIFARISPSTRGSYNYDPSSRTAWNRTCPPHSVGSAAVVSAGTSDSAVVGEASRTLLYLGWKTDLYEDCGVAGLWRIQKYLPKVNQHDVIIVAAGMDGALPTVLAGLTDKPIFAVPTSVGYGASEGGRTALNAMLTSCAPGISVLNIDNGYGAACAASRVLRLLESKRK